ncbi:MAG: hypothetical protein WKF57_06705 [Nakamurella sp.]
MTHAMGPTDPQFQEHEGAPPPVPPQPPAPQQEDFRLVQFSQRGTLVGTSVALIVIGALGILLGLFSPAILGGTGLLIAGAVFLVGGALVASAVVVANWWQFESRQQLGLLAHGLSEQFGNDRS